jgi:hypothetical protein
LLSGVARFGAPTPIFQPTKSTALDDGESTVDPAIPRTALWVMKYRRHRTFRRGDDDVLRVALGEGDERVYVTDDGDSHVMMTRQVGVDPQGVEYFLVGRMRFDDYSDYANGFKQVGNVCSDASELALCSAYAALDAVSNVTLVERYKSVAKVPEEYLPGTPLLHFSDDDDDDDAGDDAGDAR